jgi:hypothetical protein
VHIELQVPESSIVRLTQTTAGDLELTGPWGLKTSRIGIGYDLTLARAAHSDELAITVQGGTLELGTLQGQHVAAKARRIWVQDEVVAQQLQLEAAELLYLDDGARLVAPEIDLDAQVLSSIGIIAADGKQGGRVQIRAPHVMNQGVISAKGSDGDGGSVRVQYGRYYVESALGSIDVSGAAKGGDIRIASESEESHLFSSGTQRAGGQRGGSISLGGADLKLVVSTLDVSGTRAGGAIHVGEPARATVSTRNIWVPAGTVLSANAQQNGEGGQVLLASLDTTRFTGTASANAGELGGNGGLIEISSKGAVTVLGDMHAAAPRGRAGRVLLDPKNIMIADGGSTFFQFQLVDPTPGAGDIFGYGTSLASGNVVAREYNDDFGGTDAGAAHLYSGRTGALLATLTGGGANNRVSIGGVTPLTNGNYVISSPQWDAGVASNEGAVTWGNGLTGVAGVVSASNSLVGSTPSDFVGNDEVVALPNGSYLVRTTTWHNGGAINAGAVTWGSGTAGVKGVLSASNSLVGSLTDDTVGNAEAVILSNGNYVVASTQWNGGDGAVTWGNANSGVTGVVSAANSLVGGLDSYGVGGGGVVPLTNGNYVVSSPNFGSVYGAATWGNGTTGVVGVVSASNSLVGSDVYDRVSENNGVVALSNGNYVVISPFWGFGETGSAGAVTWGNGNTGISGVVSASNSLVGATGNDYVGYGGVTALSNGNYLVESPIWDGVTADVGAITWANGATGRTGTVSSSNSLVGSTANDMLETQITELSNGNYVVINHRWHNGAVVDAGAVTWGSGTAGVTGAISAANSLVGTTTDDEVGNNGIRALINGHYVVGSTQWNNGGTLDVGAVTWGNGTTGVSGAVSSSNSLVGATASDALGGVAALENGNYIVVSSVWDNVAEAATNAGIVVLCNGTTGTTGVINAANGLVGTATNNQVGEGIVILPNGNYLVRSPNWEIEFGPTNVGAVTLCSGTVATTGAVSASNSLVGTKASDQVGTEILVLSSGNYVVGSELWDNGSAQNAGAATWVDGDVGLVGEITPLNSLVGIKTGDNVGSTLIAVTNGNYVVSSSSWDNGSATNVGALTWGNGESGVVGAVNASNSLVGMLNSSGGDFGEGPYEDTFLGMFTGSSARLLIGVGSLHDFSLDYGLLADSSLTLAPSWIEETLARGLDVTLEASNDITVTDALLVVNAGGDGGNLTLSAGRAIELDANITTDNGDLTLIANDLLGSGVVNAQRDSGPGGITWTSGTVSAGQGSVWLEVRDGAGKTEAQSGTLELGAVSAAEVFAQVTGAPLDLVGAVSASGPGDAVVLASDTQFSAEAGSIAAGPGRFLIYSPSPALTSLGSLVFDFTEYGKSLLEAPQPGNTGDGILYASNSGTPGDAGVSVDAGGGIPLPDGGTSLPDAGGTDPDEPDADLPPDLADAGDDAGSAQAGNGGQAGANGLAGNGGVAGANAGAAGNGGAGEAGSTNAGNAGTTSAGGTGTDAGLATVAGEASEDSGCSCKLVGTPRSSSNVSWLFTLLLGMAVLRRRPDSAQQRSA